jgi:uncharacterized cupredoxin-like copper-binding protein
MCPFRLRLVLPFAAIALVAAACGSSSTSAPSNMPGMDTSSTTASSGQTAGAVRTVDVTMADLKFDPTQLSAKIGETVRFRFHNTGKVAHEAIIGDAATQATHEAEMTTPSSMGMTMNSSDAVIVTPGATGELTYTFNQTGAVLIGCHEPGHFAAGMMMNLAVG